MTPATGARARRVLASTAAVTTACVLPSFLLGAMAVQVRRDLGFDESGIGIAFGAFFAAASLASAPLGRVTERQGAVASLRMAGLASAASCLLAAGAARSFATLLLPMALAGASNAFCQPAANLLIARALPPHRQGLGFAVKQAAIPASTLLAGAAVPAIALSVGWRWAFVAAAALSAVSVASVPAARSAALPVAATATGPAAVGEVGEGGPEPAGAGRGRRRRRTERRADRRAQAEVPGSVMVVLAAGIGFGAAAGGTLGSFLVSAAVDAGISEGRAGLLLSAGSVAGIAVRIGAGVRADRRDGGHLRVVARMLLLGAGAFALLASGGEWAYVVAGPLGFCTAWAWPGLFNLAVVRANPLRPAAATSITQTGTYIGAVSGPLLFGAIADAASYRVAWLVAVVCSLLGAAGMAEGRRRLRAWRAMATVVPAPGTLTT